VLNDFYGKEPAMEPYPNSCFTLNTEYNQTFKAVAMAAAFAFSAIN
jgi:hypothetical protein